MSRQMSYNYREELKSIFQIYRIPLAAQEEIEKLLKKTQSRARYDSWSEGYDDGYWQRDSE